MMRSVVACAMLLIATPAAAQTAPKAVKTLRIEATQQPLFTVEADGTVRIDWRRVEAVARSADLTDRDTARALMAVRDGTAQPAH
jgi:hypothetical protein